MITNKKIPISYWFQIIKLDLFIVLLLSIGLFFFHTYLVKETISMSVPAFLGTSIALILSFKLSQSYDRWWEARKIWGAIVNDSRTLILQLNCFIGSSTSKDDIKKIAYRQIAWNYILGQNLRKSINIDSIKKYLSKEELEQIRNSSNIPLALLKKQSTGLGKLLDEGKINEFQQVQVDTTLSRLTDSLGKCERIKNTVFPKSYRLTLHFFIYMFLVFLSFALNGMKVYIEIPILVFISIPFFLLEKIAFNMQDPFENRPTDTPVTSIARTIEINIKELINDEDIPDPLVPDTFYTL